jgi:hypothetical protein
LAVAVSPADADAESAAAQLAEFDGRLYLLLVTVVYDHANWLPPALRMNFRHALSAAYTSVHELQNLLRNPDSDRRGADEVTRLIAAAGLTGAQLELKLSMYNRAEARFYGRRGKDRPQPDRIFGTASLVRSHSLAAEPGRPRSRGSHRVFGQCFRPRTVAAIAADSVAPLSPSAMSPRVSV